MEELLGDERLLRRAVGDELGAVAKEYGTPRRTVLLEQSAAPITTMDMEIADEPCHVLLSSTGLIARTANADPIPSGGGRARHDVVVARLRASSRGTFGLVTNRGRLAKVTVMELPVLPPAAAAPVLRGGVPVSDCATLDRGETVVGIVEIGADAPAIALGTRLGTVKRVVPEDVNKDLYEIVTLQSGDEIVGAANATDDAVLAFITDDAQLLHFPAKAVRPQGRPAGGMAGINLAKGARTIAFTVVPENAEVVTIAGSRSALPGADFGSIKRTPFALYPGKGRATGGVRCHGYRKGEDVLTYAGIVSAPARLAGPQGAPVETPEVSERRDGTGQVLHDVVVAAGGS